ncbi:MAG: hypothetical protein KIS74_01390 [Burkholderiales bacterium]|nr:hypothetical protein [Burkholderiales bacterium]
MSSALRKPEHFWPLVWGVACVALAGVITAEVLLGEVGAGKGPRAPAKAAEARLLPTFTLASEAQAGAETTSRPLFVPGRRPAPPAASADSGVMKKGQFVLQGTTIVGDVSFAMLKEVGSNRLHRVQKGERVNELTLAEVGPTYAVLSLGDDSERVPLLVAKASGPPAPVPAGPFASPAAPAAPAAAPAPAPSPAKAATPAAAARAAAQASNPAADEDARAARRASRASRPPLQVPPGPSGPITFEELARQRAEAMSRSEAAKR